MIQTIVGPDGEKDNEGGEIVQEMPIFDGVSAVTLPEIISAIVILASMAAILGQRSGAISRRYWIGSAIEVVFFSASWTVLALVVGPSIHAILPFSAEACEFIYDMAKVALCLAFCGLLVLGDKIRQLGVLWPVVDE